MKIWIRNSRLKNIFYLDIKKNLHAIGMLGKQYVWADKSLWNPLKVHKKALHIFFLILGLKNKYGMR